MPAAREKNGSVGTSTSRASPKVAREPLEHAESISYYVGNDSAEMATVLRIDATTLTRLREKMEVHLCTVFHSTRNTITLKCYAFKTQNDARTRKESTDKSTQCDEQNSRARQNSAVLHKLYSEHIFRKPIQKTHTRYNIGKEKTFELL